MMRRAGRVHMLRALGLAAVAAMLALVGIEVRRSVVEDRQATTAAGLVQQLLKADTAQVPGIVRTIETYRRWTDPELRRAAAEAPADLMRGSMPASPCYPSTRARSLIWNPASSTPRRANHLCYVTPFDSMPPA